MKCGICGHDIIMDVGDELKHVVGYRLGRPQLDKECWCGCKRPRMKVGGMR